MKKVSFNTDTIEAIDHFFTEGLKLELFKNTELKNDELIIYIRTNKEKKTLRIGINKKDMVFSTISDMLFFITSTMVSTIFKKD